VSTNNLKKIDLQIPLNKLTVVTGVSGSGKSSLVFDTLYAESYRRFVDSLSSYARQYLKALPKPRLEAVTNLPPSVAVKQGRSHSNQRSTVGTLTELTHLLQTLFFHLAKVQCYKCGRSVKKYNAVSISKDIVRLFSQGELIQIMAPLKTWGGLKASLLKKQLEEQGFVRVFVNGIVSPIADMDVSKIYDYSVVVDRVFSSQEEESRIYEAVETALKVGRGICSVYVAEKEIRYSKALECTHCGIGYLEPSMALFSFNHPLGACDRCHGYGRISNLDWNKIIPDLNSSIYEEGIAPLNFGSHAEYYNVIIKNAKKSKIDFKKQFKSYTAKEWQFLHFGIDENFEGLKGYFNWLDSKKYKAHYRIHAARYYKYEMCPSCEGKRYSRDALVYQILDKNIASLHDLSIYHFESWINNFLNQDISCRVEGLSDVIEEIKNRIHYLSKVGLSYLSLNRVSGTLSGGELQRIHMASCLGSSLTDTMYCLDEPTSGLHARDSQNLLEVIGELRDQGNTVVVVEHDRQLLSGADLLIEIGPGAGHLGGHITHVGSYEGVPKKQVEYPRKKQIVYNDLIKLEGVTTHNLKNITVEIPFGALTVVCGVSGSGKTSLIQHTLLPMLAGGQEEILNCKAKGIGPKSLVKKIHKVLFIDQKALARSSRSNIATYLGVFDIIRRLYSQQSRSKELKLLPGAFSFNVPGGRCETCKGLGTVLEDLSFLGEIQVHCPRCEGKRFNDKVLSVTFREKNLLEVLALTVHETYDLFFDQIDVRKILQPVIELGLGYLSLGQATNSFSGGEAQRLKLLSLLKETGSATKPLLLIFDEPTTGLSDKDVYNLWKHLDFLTQKGHTVIVVEHHLDMIRHSDWLLEIGPEAAELGGQLVYQGPPGGIFSSPFSKTAPYLKL
jgi:excinuclease ABC subunit A